MSYRFINTGPRGVDENFWELNPQLKYISPFKPVFDADKSKDHLSSSKDMWCVWMLEDPSYENKVYHMGEDRKENAIENYNPAFDRNNELIQAVLLVYDDMCLSHAARSFKIETDTMIARGLIFKNEKYTFDSYKTDEKGKTITVKGSAKDLDAMRIATSKIMDGYFRIQKAFEEEQASSRVVGGRGETIRERKLLNPDIKEDYE